MSAAIILMMRDSWRDVWGGIKGAALFTRNVCENLQITRNLFCWLKLQTDIIERCMRKSKARKLHIYKTHSWSEKKWVQWMFSFQFAAASRLPTVSAFYMSLISTLISVVRGSGMRSRSYSSLSQPFLSICHFIDRRGEAGALQCLSRVEQGIEMVPLEYSCHTR